MNELSETEALKALESVRTRIKALAECRDSELEIRIFRKPEQKRNTFGHDSPPVYLSADIGRALMEFLPQVLDNLEQALKGEHAQARRDLAATLTSED
jgi:hypothetical protein